MKKEVVFAVLIGLIMGLIITYGVYRVQTSFKKGTTEVLGTPSPTPDSDSASIISLHSPEDGIVQSESTTTVTGTTIANAFIVVFVNNAEIITTADETGNFSVAIDLEPGPNVIKVHVVDESGNTYIQERLVVVSDLLDQDGNPTATSSAQTTDDNE